MNRFDLAVWHSLTTKMGSSNEGGSFPLSVRQSGNENYSRPEEICGSG